MGRVGPTIANETSTIYESARERDVVQMRKSEFLNRPDDAVVKLGGKPAKILLRRAFEQDAIHPHPCLRWARYCSSGR
jgi:hypothetical protein